MNKSYINHKSERLISSCSLSRRHIVIAVIVFLIIQIMVDVSLNRYVIDKENAGFIIPQTTASPLVTSGKSIYDVHALIRKYFYR